MALVTHMIGTWIPRASARWFPDILWRIPASSRTAYLTFDDGPNPGITDALVDALGRYDARGTFFLVGSKAEREPQTVRMLVENGHAVGNHTFTHPDPWRVPASKLVAELERTTVTLEDLSGSPVAWMRPPYGRFTPGTRSWCRLRRQRLTMWDLAPADYLETVSRADVERHVARYIRTGSIIVLHDNPRCAADTPAALENILRRLTRDGWRFHALPDLPLQ